MEIITRIKKNLDLLPSLPVSTNKVIELSNKMNITAAELNKVISLDPVLTGKVIKLVNSAYFSLPNKITSLIQAIVMLGINTVKNLALSSSVLNNFNSKKYFKALNIDSYWKHSIAVGVTAKIIASNKKINKKMLESFFIGGLLHDIGKILLNMTYPEKYLEVMNYSDVKKIPLYKVEKEVFGIDHCEVGKMIADKWSFSKEISFVIQNHHNIEVIKESKELFFIAIVLSDMFCKYLEIGFSGNKYYDLDFMYKIADIHKIDLDSLEDNQNIIFQKIKDAEIFLKVV